MHHENQVKNRKNEFEYNKMLHNLNQIQQEALDDF